MANPLDVKVIKQRDKQVVSVLREVAGRIGSNSVSVSFGIGSAYKINVDEKIPKEVESALRSQSYLIASASTNVPGFTISFHRGGRSAQNGHEKSAIYDEYSLNFDQNRFPAESEKVGDLSRIAILKLIHSKAGSFEPNRAVAGLLNKDQEQLLALHSATLDRLENLNEELLRGSVEFRKKLDNELSEKRQELEDSQQSLRQKLREEYERRKQGLTEREEELQSRLRAIDDRDNTHVRRELRADIVREINRRAKGVQLAESTRRLRRPIHLVSICLLLVFGGLAIWTSSVFISDLSVPSEQTLIPVVVGIKAFSFSVAFAATATFYIRWLNQWFVDHAEAEFQLQRLQMDIERASWVVETAFEWKQGGESSIPDTLLQPLVKNLFTKQGERVDEEEDSAADELAAALIGSAANIKLNIGGSDVELDAKSIRKLKKA